MQSATRTILNKTSSGIALTQKACKNYSTNIMYYDNHEIEKCLPPIATPGKLIQLTQLEEEAVSTTNFIKDTTSSTNIKHPAVGVIDTNNQVTLIANPTRGKFVHGRRTIDLPAEVKNLSKIFRKTRLVPARNIIRVNPRFFKSSKTMAKTNSPSEKKIHRSLGYVPPKKEYKVDTPKDDDR